MIKEKPDIDGYLVDKLEHEIISLITKPTFTKTAEFNFAVAGEHMYERLDDVVEAIFSAVKP